MEPARASAFTRLGDQWRKCGIAASRYGASRASVVLGLMDLYRHRGFRPGEALSLGLLDPKASKAAVAACFPKRELQSLQDRLNPTHLVPLTEDKDVFDAYCVERGIPVATRYATLGRASSQVVPGLTSRDQWVNGVVPGLPATFITKPSLGVYGEGVTAWTRTDAGFRDHTQREFSAQGVYDHCCADPKYDRFIVQERLINHPSLVTLTGASTLQTLRLATLVGDDDVPRVLYAAWKLVVGKSDAITDNYHFGRSGNMLANAALPDGVLGAALGPSNDGVGLNAVAIHPVTGIAIEGFRLPDWNAVIDLALRSARLLLPLRTIGWDIGMTPNGPVIVEANRWWDPPNEEIFGAGVPGLAQHDMIVGSSLLRAADKKVTRS